MFVQETIRDDCRAQRHTIDIRGYLYNIYGHNWYFKPLLVLEARARHAGEKAIY